MAKYTLETPIKELLANKETAKIIKENAPGLAKNPIIKRLPMGLSKISGFAPDKLTPELLSKIEGQFAELG